jgi:general secretion pathway protein G
MTGSLQTVSGAGRSVSPDRRAGFTLIELLTVMLIMAILAGLLIGVGEFARQKGLETRAKADLESFRDALEEHRLAIGSYPLTLDKATNGLPATVDLLDPWKRNYVYSFSTNRPGTYVLYSKGRNEASKADDIHSGK